MHTARWRGQWCLHLLGLPVALLYLISFSKSRQEFAKAEEKKPSWQTGPRYNPVHANNATGRMLAWMGWCVLTDLLRLDCQVWRKTLEELIRLNTGVLSVFMVLCLKKSNCHCNHSVLALKYDAADRINWVIWENNRLSLLKKKKKKHEMHLPWQPCRMMWLQQLSAQSFNSPYRRRATSYDMRWFFFFLHYLMLWGYGINPHMCNYVLLD